MAADFDHRVAAHFISDEFGAIGGNANEPALCAALSLGQVAWQLNQHIVQLLPQIAFKLEHDRTEKRVSAAVHFRHLDFLIDGEIVGAKAVAQNFADHRAERFVTRPIQQGGDKLR